MLVFTFSVVLPIVMVLAFSVVLLFIAIVHFQVFIEKISVLMKSRVLAKKWLMPLV